MARHIRTHVEKFGGTSLVVAVKLALGPGAALRLIVVELIAELGRHKDFTLANPNRVRALYGAFAANQWAFNDKSGRGYRMVADLIIALDQLNPQTAARLVPPLGRWRRFDPARGALMQAELRRILAQPGLSRDVTEQGAKSLED